MANVMMAHASISENGTIRGTAGDQTGKEVCIRSWYKHSKGWVMLRAKDPKMREYIAQGGERAAKNDNIGYDQIENQTLWKDVEKKDFNPAMADEPTETDCARLVRLCVQFACKMVGNGKSIPDFYTATLKNKLKGTGLFEVYTASKYTTKSDYLMRGDILVTKTKGHTAIVISNGERAEVIETEFVDYDFGQRIIRSGCEGNDVKELQGYLEQLGYDCGGESGEFDDSTEIAVRAFQTVSGCEVDGEVGPITIAALEEALKDVQTKNARYVRIVNGNCYVRKAPNKESNPPMGVVRKGTLLKFGGEISADGWHLIEYDGANGWVSGRYSRLED